MNTIANFVVATNFDNLPSNVVTQAKVAARDNLGVTVAAHKDKAVAAVRRVLRCSLPICRAMGNYYLQIKSSLIFIE